MCLADITAIGNEPRPTTKDGFTKWEPLSGFYVDPADLVAASFAQSAETHNGVVAPFQLAKPVK